MERQEFLCHLRRMQEQVEDFKQRVADFLQSLPRLPDEDFEPPVTPEAEIQGTLECLLADDLQPALKKLAELEDYLRDDPRSYGC